VGEVPDTCSRVRSSCELLGWLDALGVPLANADLCDLAHDGSSGAVRKAVMAKDRTPSMRLAAASRVRSSGLSQRWLQVFQRRFRSNMVQGTLEGDDVASRCDQS